MESHVCNHPKVPHTVEYMLSSEKGRGASVSRPFDDLEDADIFAQKIIRQNTARMIWLKIHRSDNPAYSCFMWENSKKESDVAENKVKLEVDMEPLVSAFDNISLGFKIHGRSIARLWVFQGITAGLVIVDVLTRIF